MELNWELCRIFYQVARCRNFSRAAAMLFTSQPAVSRSMAALERELGCRLFIRNRRGVELTPEGRMFYAHVEAGCEQFRRGREELEQAVGLQSGSIALGASETALRHWLLPRLDRFHALYPGCGSGCSAVRPGRPSMNSSPGPSILPWPPCPAAVSGP